MSNLLPDSIFESVCDISPEYLKDLGIKAVLCDLDSTLMPALSQVLPEKSVRWIESIKNAGISVMVLSNNSKEYRVAEVCKKLGIEFIHLAKKPFAKGYRLAIRRLSLKPSEIAMVGDQIYTDVLGANRCGMFTILVESLDLNLIYVKLRRLLEKPVINRAKRRQEGVRG